LVKVAQTRRNSDVAPIGRNNLTVFEDFNQELDLLYVHESVRVSKTHSLQRQSPQSHHDHRDEDCQHHKERRTAPAASGQHHVPIPIGCRRCGSAPSRSKRHTLHSITTYLFGIRPWRSHCHCVGKREGYVWVVIDTRPAIIQRAVGVTVNQKRLRRRMMRGSKRR